MGTIVPGGIKIPLRRVLRINCIANYNLTISRSNKVKQYFLRYKRWLQHNGRVANLFNKYYHYFIVKVTHNIMVSTLATPARGPGSKPIAGRKKREINFSGSQHSGVCPSWLAYHVKRRCLLSWHWGWKYKNLLRKKNTLAVTHHPWRFTHTVKPVFKEKPQYPRESVPTWQVSLRHRFLNMGKIGHRSEKVSPDHRLSPRHSVPWRQVLLYINTAPLWARGRRYIIVAHNTRGAQSNT